LTLRYSLLLSVWVDPSAEHICPLLSTESVELHLFSGHDSTLVPLLLALGANDGEFPRYASHLTIELATRSVADGLSGLSRCGIGLTRRLATQTPKDWLLQEIVLLLVVCARINRPFLFSARLHCPHFCNAIARLLGNIRPPPTPPFSYW